MNILGKHVLIRAIEELDLDLLFTWANDPDIWYQLDGWHFPTNRASMQSWFKDIMKDTLNQRFAIEAKDMGLIGTISLGDIDWKNNHGLIGIILGPKDLRGKGYAVDAMMAIERYAFEELHFSRLDGTIIEYNETSSHFVAKCGWKEEGRQRNWYFRRNRYWDRILVGITRDDYFDHIKKTHYWDIS